MPVVEIKENKVSINIRVQPKSAKTGWGAVLEDTTIQLRINAPPIDGAANKACLKFIAKEMKVPKSNVSIIKGEKNRNKTVLIEGPDPDKLSGFLKMHSITATVSR